MSDRKFVILLAVLLAVCVIVTLCHLVYVIDAYKSCSIIYFIGKELW